MKNWKDYNPNPFFGGIIVFIHQGRGEEGVVLVLFLMILGVVDRLFVRLSDI
jgi:hypothetical protein